MYQPKLGDRIKFTGYTPEAYKNGSVPIFMSNEGIVIELDGKLYLKLDSEYILPVYYLDNIELIHTCVTDPTLQTPQKCNGCDAWIDYTGTPAHCCVDRCIKGYKCLKCETILDTSNSICERCFQKFVFKEKPLSIPRIKEESFFGNQQFQNEDTRMETCQYYSDYNQCAMGHYDEDRNVFCAVCLICDDYKKKEEKTRPIRRNLDSKWCLLDKE